MPNSRAFLMFATSLLCLGNFYIGETQRKIILQNNKLTDTIMDIHRQNSIILHAMERKK